MSDANINAALIAAAPEPDSVNHPKHYTDAPGLPECIEVIEGLGLGFHLGNVLKYLWRAGRKADALEDLKKAAWYLAREIKRREAHR